MVLNPTFQFETKWNKGKLTVSSTVVHKTTFQIKLVIFTYQILFSLKIIIVETKELGKNQNVAVAGFKLVKFQ